MFGLGKRKREATIDEVAQLLIAKLQALRGDRTYKFDDEVDVIRASDGAVINVERVFEQYLQAPEQGREQVLDRYAQALTPQELPQTLAHARPHLLPALRNLMGFDLARIQSGAAKPLALQCLLPFSEELAVTVVQDSEQAMLMVDDSRFAQWGCTPGQGLAIALDNLRLKSPPKFTQVTQGLFRSNFGDEYDAGRLLLTDMIQQLPVKGTPMAMAPNRSTLLVAGDQDPQAIAGMLQIASKDLLEGARSLGSEMFRLSDGGWQVAQPSGGLGVQLRNLRVQYRGADYNSQQAAIEQANKAANLDIFVATHRLGQKKTGEVFGYCTLTKDVLTSLPKADFVVLVEDPHAAKVVSKIVAWSELEREAGHLLEPMAYTLPRFRVQAHPDPQAIDRMEAAVLGG
jgi:hypothetical protein